MAILIFVLAAFLPLSIGQDIGCYITGECTFSLELGDIDNIPSASKCLDKCKYQVAGCNYFTYYEETLSCHLYENCPILNVNRTDATSGDSDCVSLEPTCFEQGQCLGTYISEFESQSALDCLNSCNNYEPDVCGWWTFHKDESRCDLTLDCPTVLPCTTCSFGENGCGKTMILNS